MKNNPIPKNQDPIGVFDSGIGGLTVVKEIIKKLPNESIIYLGDTARVPYGTRSKEIIIKFAKELTKFLIKRKVKFLVVACNTISSVALEEIKRISPVSLIGVIKPAVKKAIQITKNKKIGVIGTQSTILSKAYEIEIQKINPQVKIVSVACPLFVPLAEEGLGRHQATRFLAEDYLKRIISFGADTLILGCTHYPLLSRTILETVGPNIILIDSAEPAVEELKRILEKNKLLSDNLKPTREFFVTDAPERVYNTTNSFLGDTLNGKLIKITL